MADKPNILLTITDHEAYYGHDQAGEFTYQWPTYEAFAQEGVRFTRDVGHGICIQVSQGNDTDSFGSMAGSLLGACFGPGHLEPRWLEPFNDDIRTTLARFYERSLSKLARRMGELPRRIVAA
jgi:hypothetical protein